MFDRMGIGVLYKEESYITMYTVYRDKKIKLIKDGKVELEFDFSVSYA